MTIVPSFVLHLATMLHFVDVSYMLCTSERDADYVQLNTCTANPQYGLHLPDWETKSIAAFNPIVNILIGLNKSFGAKVYRNRSLFVSPSSQV